MSLDNHKRPFRCWKKDGHGDADLSYALTQSCDVFFYRVAQLTGIDLISEHLYKYGFGQKTYIDLYGEKTGLVPDRQWKSKAKARTMVSRRNIKCRYRPGIFSCYSYAVNISYC